MHNSWKKGRTKPAMSRPQVFTVSCLVRSTAFFVWLAMRSVSAQSSDLFLNELVIHCVPFDADRAVLLYAQSPHALNIGWYSVGGKTFIWGKYDVASDSLFVSTQQVTVSIDTLVPFHSRGNSGILIVNKKVKQIAVYRTTGSENLQLSQILSIPVEPQKISIIDLNNDGQQELLVLNRESPGVLTYSLSREGIFQKSQTIAPNCMVGDIVQVYMNNDMLPDLILYDWVKSEFHVLYGIGKERFLDASIFPVQGDIRFLAASNKYVYHTIKLAALVKHESIVQVWEGNELGDLKLKQTLPCMATPTSCTFTDLDGDGNDELCVLDGSPSMSVYKTQSNGKLILENEYGLSATPESFFMTRGTPSYHGAAFVWYSQPHLLFSFINNSLRTVLQDTVIVPLPGNPVDITVEDTNGDGKEDILLAHSSKKQVSILYGSPTSFPIGYEYYSLSQKPTQMKFVSQRDSAIRVIVTYPELQAVSLVSLERNRGVKENIIPTEGMATIVAPVKTTPYIGVLNESSQGENVSLSLYEEVGTNTYIERTFRLTSPARLLGADVGDVNADGIPDILYAYCYNDSATARLGVAYGDSSFALGQRIITPDLFLPFADRYFLWLADLDGNDTVDVLLYAGEPWHQLWCLQGDGSGIFQNPHFITNDIRINSRSQLKLVDVNGDDRLDILLTIPKDNEVLLFRALYPFVYSSGETILEEEGVEQCAISDIDGDGCAELLAIFPKKNILKILNGRVWLTFGAQ